MQAHIEHEVDRKKPKPLHVIQRNYNVDVCGNKTYLVE